MLGEPFTNCSIMVRRAVVCEPIKTFGWTFEKPSSRIDVNTLLATNV